MGIVYSRIRVMVVAVAALASACAAPTAQSPAGPGPGLSPVAASAPDGDAARVPGTVHGRVAPSLTAFLDDNALAVPSADVALDAPAQLRVDGAPSLWAAPPLAGYLGARPGFAARYRGPEGLPPRSWRLHITRYDSGKAVRTLGDVGPPPARIEWDGLDDRGEPVPQGALLLAQLDVRSVRGAGAASPRVPFGLAAPQGRERLERVVPGAPFDRAGKPSAALRRLVDQVAAMAAPGSRVSLEVHDDGAGDRLSSIARTQRESQRIVALLREAGVPGRIIEARGRGSLEPLEAPTSRDARQRNRRIVAVVEVPQRKPERAALPPPRTAPPVPAGASLSGVPLRIGRDGSFSFPVPPVVRSAVLQLRASDGRRASTLFRRDGEVASPAVASAAAGGKSVRLVADARAGTVALDGDALPAGWARVRVELASADEGQVAFALRVPGELAVRSWRLRIAPLRAKDSSGGKGARTVEGEGAPPRLWVWDGRDDQRDPQLEPGRRFRVTLEVRGPGGNAGWSPDYVLAVPPARWRGLELSRGRLFRGTRPSAVLRNFLSRFATVARRRRRTAFSLHVEIAADRGTTAERRLAVAARVAATRKYLRRLRVPANRFELRGSLVDGRDGRGAVRVRERARAPSLRPPDKAEAQLQIDGKRRRLDASGAVATSVELTGGVVVVEVRRPTGHRAQFAIRR